MTAWTIEPSAWQGEPCLTVSNHDGTVRAVVALRGATLISWHIHIEGEDFELTDGYRDLAELNEQSGVRNGVMAPFCNRVADGRYHFDGREHDLLPGVTGDRTVYHGFARTLPFVLESATTTGDGARLVLRSDEIRPGRFAGYPFALDLTVTYTLTQDEISLEVEATNTGDATAPYAAGWHPYFQLRNGTDGIDDLELRIPARTLIRTDDALIPTDGPGCRLDLDDLPQLDFRRPSPVGQRVIDACYADLHFGPDGRAETTLRDPKTGRELRIWQESGFLHLFTGDTLPRDMRKSIAIEPVEAMTNAFNRDECQAAISLPPGRTRRFRCGAWIF
ncbi:aldose 1-epimerase [Streptacidiphilus pinicola]|uniref:Aldose 1-epimerase n=1 Tax=Streptacidiphilus pinicola TaxID=2219663 RepID=A0A2X0K956_9ACTN|nr:aldose 1-epimerase [Streptacidiphilus pinicola]RAG84029.1 aldose 1-epimerase [Streptacidiphilus pinicola]